jgi:hypothetical protein
MVGTSITLIVTLVVGIIVVNQFFLATPLMGETTYTKDQLLNTSFTDNTGSTPDYWTDVTSGENRLCSWDSTNKWVYENGDNGLAGWYQSLTVSDFDTVSSATLSASYKLGDNTGITSITVKAMIENSTDNITIWQSTSKDNSAGWVSIDNNVASHITVAGTYKLWLWENIRTTMDNNNFTYWDDANLVVNSNITLVDSEAQATYNNTMILAWAGIGLMALAIIVLAAVTILGIVRSGLGGGGKI